jgi:amidase
MSPARFADDPLRIALDVPGASDPELPLAGVSLAVKDIIDVAGIPTGLGVPDMLAAAQPAAGHAVAVQRLLDAGARIVGKSHTDEFARSLLGVNHHYGAPLNPAAPGRVPGGSSSGSASAVASGRAQLALGSDTAGSIRVPAAYCGIFGLRPTHGRVPLDGVWPLAPSFDVVGPLAADGELLYRAGLALLDGADSCAAAPAALALAADLVEQADAEVAAAITDGARELAGRLGVALITVPWPTARLQAWADAFGARQSIEAWQSDGPVLTEIQPRLGPEIAARFAASRALDPAEGCAADEAAGEIREVLEDVLAPGAALVLPSTPTVAPLLPAGDDREGPRAATIRLTALSCLLGAPAISIPVATADGLPAGLSLLGRPGEDERLLTAARGLSAPRWG